MVIEAVGFYCVKCGVATDWDLELGPEPICSVCWDGEIDLVTPAEAKALKRCDYRLAHKVEIKAWGRAYRLAHKAELKAYREAHKVEISAYMREYRKAHLVENREYQSRYQRSRDCCKAKQFRQLEQHVLVSEANKVLVGDDSGSD